MSDHIITDPDVMVWVDVETTGLDPIMDQLLEVGLMVTDSKFQPLAWTSTLVGIGGASVERIMALRNAADPYIFDMHNRSNLWVEHVEACADGRLPTLTDAQNHLLGWWSECFGDRTDKPPMCGSSVQFDRGWLAAWMPDLHANFHYRNIDVSTVKELCRRTNRHAFDRLPVKQEVHRVIPDLRETLNEMTYYRKHFLKTR